jgi:glyoxylase-like metal-dependent hydrolase (beta-lactamase superfamily II)
MCPPRGPFPASSTANLNRSPVSSFPLVHQITLPTPWEQRTVHVYLIESEPLTLIDCGVDTDEARAALSSALEALGYGIEDIERVVLTHYHRDHLGQAESLRESADALEVWAHQDAVPAIELFSPERDENIAGTASLFRDYGVPEDLVEEMTLWRSQKLSEGPALCRATRVDRPLRDGDRLSFKDLALEVIHSPGHTAGHILLHHVESGVLITGDQILGGAVPNTENYYLEGLPDPADPLHRRPRYRGLLEYRRSLRALRRQSFTTILPGYGGVIRSADRAIRDALLYYEVRIQRIERSLRSVGALGQSVTAFELWRALFPNDDPITEIRTRLLMVIGALDVLEESGQVVTTRRDDGVLLHTHTSPPR